ncbi:MAG: hypothetical protein K2H15_04865, partial [Muribaculaceae bacterium]|nr:hypothetical protein [Muribaculaceae bacterium]
LYSIKLDEINTDEYSRILTLWKNLDYLVNFFKENAEKVNQPFWLKSGLDPSDPLKSAGRVAKEAIKLASHIHKLSQNTLEGGHPDLEDFFKPLGGKYSYLRELEPQKSYGLAHPPLLRLYAIKLGINVYIIVYGGIKLGRTIQDSPGLYPQVFNRIDNVISYLKANGVLEGEDI